MRKFYSENATRAAIAAAMDVDPANVDLGDSRFSLHDFRDGNDAVYRKDQVASAVRSIAGVGKAAEILEEAERLDAATLPKLPKPLGGKIFLSEEQTCYLLDKTPTELERLIEDRELDDFNEGDHRVYRTDQVLAVAASDPLSAVRIDTLMQFFESGQSSLGEFVQAKVDEIEGGTLIFETEGELDPLALGGEGLLGGVPGLGLPRAGDDSSLGVDLLGGDFLGGDLGLDDTSLGADLLGGGLGLDDTSLGADLLEDVYGGDADSSDFLLGGDLFEDPYEGLSSSDELGSISLGKTPFLVSVFKDGESEEDSLTVVIAHEGRRWRAGEEIARFEVKKGVKEQSENFKHSGWTIEATVREDSFGATAKKEGKLAGLGRLFGVKQMGEMILEYRRDREPKAVLLDSQIERRHLPVTG